MKKIFSTLIVILLVAFVVYFVYNNVVHKESYTEKRQKLYDAAIDYLNKDAYKNNPIDTPESYRFFLAYDALGTTKKDGYEYAYMWILGEGYYLENNELKVNEGYSMFFKFKFKDGKVVEYENPKDGNEYKNSVKEMCPDNEMSDKVIKYKSKLSNKVSAEEYYKNLEKD